jgi:hypothetical protein
MKTARQRSTVDIQIMDFADHEEVVLSHITPKNFFLSKKNTEYPLPK